MRLFLLLWLLTGSACAGLAEARQPYPFAVSAERIGSGQNLIARNLGPAPVSVRLTLSAADNVVASQPLPVNAIVRPYSEMVLLQIRPADPARGLRFSSQSAYNLGNFHAQHDPQARYRLPFADGGSFVISQAANGPLTTHTAADSENAVDFTLPEYTPIVAARDGTVIETESANRYGGRDRVLLNMANYVRILHADETVATYAHLAPGGVTVAPGQRVTAGTLIGYSGATGYTAGPHLHFVVQKPVPTAQGFTMRSLPLRFYVGNPPYVFRAAHPATGDGRLFDARHGAAAGQRKTGHPGPLTATSAIRRPLAAYLNGCWRRIVSSRSGPVETMAIGTWHSCSRRLR